MVTGASTKQRHVFLTVVCFLKHLVIAATQPSGLITGPLLPLTLHALSINILRLWSEVGFSMLTSSDLKGFASLTQSLEHDLNSLVGAMIFISSWQVGWASLEWKGCLPLPVSWWVLSSKVCCHWKCLDCTILLDQNMPMLRLRRSS